jgi:hypothetical protein
VNPQISFLRKWLLQGNAGESYMDAKETPLLALVLVRQNKDAVPQRLAGSNDLAFEP